VQPTGGHGVSSAIDAVRRSRLLCVIIAGPNGSGYVKGKEHKPFFVEPAADFSIVDRTACSIARPLRHSMTLPRALDIPGWVFSSSAFFCSGESFSITTNVYASGEEKCRR
jgi:hypothetical protein